MFWMFVLPYSDEGDGKLGLARPCGCSEVVLGVTKGGQTLGKEEKNREEPSAVTPSAAQQGHHESRSTHLIHFVMKLGIST